MTLNDYFNLSKPILGEAPGSPAAGASPAPAATPAAATAAAPAPALEREQLSLVWQIAVYGVLVLSILSSRFLDLYRAGVVNQFVLDWQYLLFMAIASLLAFPVVYDRARLSTGQPVLVQIGLIFTTGMGWEKIVATAVGK